MGSAAITAVAASKHEFCALGRDDNIRRWQMPETKATSRSSSGIFSPDGKWLIARFGSRSSLLETATGAVKVSGGTRDFFARAFDPSGDYLLGLQAHNYEVRAFKDGRILPERMGSVQYPTKAMVTTPKFSPDSKTILISYYFPVPEIVNVDSAKYIAEVWDWKAGKILATQHPASNVLSFYGPDSDTVFMDTREQLSAWHVSRNAVEPVSLKTDGVRTAWTALPNQGLAACAVTSKDTASGNADPDEDSDSAASEAGSGNQVIVWKYPVWEEQVRLDHPDKVLLISFSQDGSRLLSVTFDGTVRLWDWKERKQLAMVPIGSNALAAEITPEGQIAVLVRNKFAIYDWQAEKLREQVCQRVRENLSADAWTRGFQLDKSDYPAEKLCPKLP
jgi:WD40 repeat protein